jgi:hypothetical protein
MEPEGSLSQSQEPATCLCPEPDQSSPWPPPLPPSWRSIFRLSSHLRLGLPSRLFPSCFPTKIMYTPHPHSATCHVQLILDLITQTIICLMLGSCNWHSGSDRLLYQLWSTLRPISGFHSGINETCAYLGYYAEQNDFFTGVSVQLMFPTFKVQAVQEESASTAWPFKMRPICSPETLVRNHHTLRKMSKERRSYFKCVAKIPAKLSVCVLSETSTGTLEPLWSSVV